MIRTANCRCRNHAVAGRAAPSRSNRRRPRPPPPDFSKVEIKTTDLGDNVYMLEGQGGNITVAVAKDGIIMVDGEFAPLHDKIKAAISDGLEPADQISDQHPFSRRPHRRQRTLCQGRRHGRRRGQRQEAARGRHHQRPDRRRRRRRRRRTRCRRKTYTGAFKIRLQGRVADLKHIANAHTDGDTYVWFKTANVLSTGDTFTNGRYPNIDFANGGNIKGMIAATDTYLKLTNDKTRIVPGHGPIADKAALDGIPHHADHRARPHGEARQGRQERGRRGGGKAVRRPRCQMGADASSRARILSAWSITRSPTSLTPGGSRSEKALAQELKPMKELVAIAEQIAAT